MGIEIVEGNSKIAPKEHTKFGTNLNYTREACKSQNSHVVKSFTVESLYNDQSI